MEWILKAFYNNLPIIRLLKDIRPKNHLFIKSRWSQNARYLAGTLRVGILVLLQLISLSAEGQNVSQKTQKHVWRQLFNGKDLQGWKHVGSGYMAVEDSMIITHGGMGLMYWEGEKFGNCVIRVIFKMKNENSNSGVFIRIPIEPREPWMPVWYGYKIQIGNEPEGEVENEFHITGTIYGITKPRVKALKTGTGWNRFEIILDGSQTIVMYNGVKVTDYKEGDSVYERKSDQEPYPGRRPEKGYIGIQNYHPESVVFYKEISISPLK